MAIGVGAELSGLALSAFLSATILPGGSEAVLAAVLALGASPAWAAVAVATVANTLGSIANWGIGRYLAGYRDHPRFPVSPEQYERAVARFRRFGPFALLLCWVPLIGDPLTLVAGVLRTPLAIFIPLVGLVKLLRYLVIAGVVGLF